MKYVLGVGLLYKKYKKQANIRIFSNNRLINDYILDEDVNLKKVTNINTEFVKKYTGSIMKPMSIKDSDELVDLKLPSKITLYELDEEAIGDKISIEVKNDDNNYTNGFMSKFAYITPFTIFLIPKSFLVNGAKLFWKIYKHYNDKVILPNHNNNFYTGDRASWPIALSFELLKNGKTIIQKRNLYPTTSTGSNKSQKMYHKKDNISPGIQIGGSFSMYYHVKKKYGIKMLTEANNNNIKGYFTDFDRWFLLLLCNSNFINTTNETA